LSGTGPGGAGLSGTLPEGSEAAPGRDQDTAGGRSADLRRSLAAILRSGSGRLPLPGSGQTLRRWQALADVAAQDLALVKLFEGHTDALAIMAELGAADVDPASVWGTWAAEPPSARLELRRGARGPRLTGRKSWCSGAGIVSHALVTAWDGEGRQCLAAVAIGQPGVTVTTDGWHAVGMGRAASGDVLFDAAAAVEIGIPGQYTGRPGFWQGGCGIAACWYGGAIPFADAVADVVTRRDDPHAAAHLGAIDTALTAARALLIETASWIDEHPVASAQMQALRSRAAVEEAVSTVLAHAGRALGAGPLCRDAALAQRFADLPVFLRQSHAERDLAELGRLLSARKPAPAGPAPAGTAPAGTAPGTAGGTAADAAGRAGMAAVTAPGLLPAGPGWRL